MKNFFRIIRGALVGLIIWGLASVTAYFVAEYLYPFRMDSSYVPGFGGFSRSATAFDEAMPTIFLFTIISYAVVYIIWYLYMRRAYYKKFPNEKRF